MSTLKHILQNYEAKLDDKIDYLVEAGLFEEKKVGMLKRAVNKNPNNLTMAESKVLKEFVDNVVSQLLYEKQDHLSAYDKKMNKNKNVDKELPTVIILKRKAIRVYPDNQKIALYYSQALDRYISIPYGPKGEALGMTMNESIDPKVNPQDSNKIPSANPKSPSEREMKKDVDTGDILKMMKKNEPVNPRMNFAPSADPKMRIDEKSTFRKNLNILRENDNKKSYTKTDAALDAASLIPGPVGVAATLSSAARNVAKGKYVDAGLDAIGAFPVVGYGAKAVKAARVMSRVSKARKQSDALKNVEKMTVKNKGRIRKPESKKDTRSRKRDDSIGTTAASALEKLSGSTDALSGPPLFTPTTQTYSGFGNITQGRIRGAGHQATMDPSSAYQTFTVAGGVNTPPTKSWQNESNLSLIKNLSKSKSLTEQSLRFGENSVTINKGTAKKVMKVYNSLNESNKKKMENMLSESASSFKKAIQFAVRH